MKKKYIIHDEDGKQFEVEETIDEQPVEEIIEEEKVADDFGGLTEEEISALKRLASVADKIIALIPEEVHDEDEKKAEDDDFIEEKEEEVIDTDEGEHAKTCDSKKSFTSIENRKKANDSIDSSEDINAAWAKRYNSRG